MTPDLAAEYESGDLRVDAVSGQVRNGEAASVRLGPVNMKVLLTLLRRPGEVVSRSEIFASVWGNQLVSDDALTRCVSDVRAELKKLSGRDDLIETLPKRGYRWRIPVRALGEAGSAAAAATGEETQGAAVMRAAPTTVRLGRLIVAGIAWLLALAAMATVIVWAIDRVSGSGPAIVAVLPVAAGNADRSLAALVDNELTEALIRSADIEVLARSAVDSRPPNPFPFFYFEFGARWLVESELRKTETQTLLSVSLVDARTGIVLLQSNSPVSPDENPVQQSIEAIVAFIESERRRSPSEIP